MPPGRFQGGRKMEKMIFEEERIHVAMRLPQDVIHRTAGTKDLFPTSPLRVDFIGFIL